MPLNDDVLGGLGAEEALLLRAEFLVLSSWSLIGSEYKRVPNFVLRKLSFCSKIAPILLFFLVIFFNKDELNDGRYEL